MSAYYLAAHYPRIQEMQKVAKKLKDMGHTITSRWIDGNETGKTWEEIAQVDLEDINACDILLCFTGQFTLPSGELIPAQRGVGHQIEYGLAYGLYKSVIMVGPYESPLHRFAGVRQYPTFNKYLKSLLH